MRFLFLLVAMLSLARSLEAQAPAVRPADAGVAEAADATVDLPVSLDRIRDRLKQPTESRLRNLDVKPDFSVQIDEQRRIDEILSKLDVTTGPAPAGGLYGYEQQRRLFNPTDRPLQQPYAAFSGGQFITIAIQNLIGRYLGGKALSAVSSAERSHAEAQAREEVDRSIGEYCADRPDRDTIAICRTP
jgi:hypothetical protein